MIVGGEDGFDLVARDVGGLGVVGLENGFGGGDGEDFAGEEGVVGAQEDVGAGGGHGKEEEDRGEMELHVRHNRGLAPEKGSRWRGAEARVPWNAFDFIARCLNGVQVQQKFIENRVGRRDDSAE